jgi:hypothetical protein
MLRPAQDRRRQRRARGVDADAAESDAAERAGAAGTTPAITPHGAAREDFIAGRAMNPALPMNCTPPGIAVRGLTPELSRAAKRRRLGRIVRRQAGISVGAHCPRLYLRNRRHK